MAQARTLYPRGEADLTRMTPEEIAVLEAAHQAERYLPPPSFAEGSSGREVCRALVRAVKRLRKIRRVPRG